MLLETVASVRDCKADTLLKLGADLVNTRKSIFSVCDCIFLLPKVTASLLGLSTNDLVRLLEVSQDGGGH